MRSALIQCGKILSFEARHSNVNQSTKKLVSKLAEISKLIRTEIHGIRVAATVKGVPGPVQNGIVKNFRPLSIKETINFQSNLKSQKSNPMFVEKT